MHSWERLRWRPVSGVRSGGHFYWEREWRVEQVSGGGHRQTDRHGAHATTSTNVYQLYKLYALRKSTKFTEIWTIKEILQALFANSKIFCRQMPCYYHNRNMYYAFAWKLLIKGITLPWHFCKLTSLTTVIVLFDPLISKQMLNSNIIVVWSFLKF